MKKEKSCGAFLFRKHEGSNEVLIIRQVQGHWCFPKGHVEKHETEKETALREIYEETGLKAVLIDGFRETLCYSPKENVMKDVVYFIGKPAGGKIRVQEEELSEIRFVSFEKARALITYPNDADLFERAAAWFEAHEEKWL